MQDDLGHVLWIGGPPRSGKTTVARALARRHGLRLYQTDAHTWSHRDRALAAGHPGALRWEAMTVEERQRIAPDEIFDLWIHWERGPMIVDDLRALPTLPLIVAEGTTVPAGGTHALWLDRPPGRPDNALVRTFAGAILEHAERHGIPVLTVDWTVEETIAAVERHFADALALGPRAETVEERRALLREANEAVAAQALAYLARPWSSSDPESFTRDFVCECDDPECRAVLTLPVAEFVRAAAAGPVLASVHSVP